jgi:hypothetical protein
MASTRFENRYFRVENSAKTGFRKLTMMYSRRVAHRYRKQVVRARGSSVLTRSDKKAMKEYARKRFGTGSYWPYLAYYTEVRGHYVDGWLPYDYYRYIMLPRINPPYSCEISEHKTYDHRIFQDFAITPLFIFVSGIYMNAGFKHVTAKEVRDFLKEYNDLIVVKEERGTHGLQVKVMKASEFDPDSLITRLNYIIQPYVKQYGKISELYPHSVNTFRVVTFLRPDCSVVVKSSILRFGVDGSKIDNLSARGQFIYFDSEGKASEQAYNILGLPTGTRHKNTGFVYADFSIPMYGEILEKCKMAHFKYPYVRLVGWDVCVNEKGEPKLIEWNADNPGFYPEEALFGPFYPDDAEILLK